MTGRMKHPEHGWHVPMPGEAEGMLKNGWVWESATPPAESVHDLKPGYVPEAPTAPPDPQPMKVDRRRKEFRNAASSNADQ